MIPFEEVDRAAIPGQNNDIILHRRGDEWSIRTGGTELMNSRVHGSEEALARETCRRLEPSAEHRILIGGLGMGFTLSKVLRHVGPDAAVIVAELIPDVIRWNREYLGHLAGHALKDHRVSAVTTDVARIIDRDQSAWDAVILDVDNGPAGLTQTSNNRLYNETGLALSFAALRPRGILAVWSAGDDPAFTKRLTRCGFITEILTVRSRKPGKGGRHTIWLGKKP
ncbi:spermidine synthase [Desulfatiferula olefinivorans]